MPLRIGGISSGLDSASLIEKLMQIERQPLIQLEEKKTTEELRKELLSEISSSLSALQSKIASLFEESTWNQVVATSSDEDVVSITTGEDSIAGTYNFTNITLATTTHTASNELVAGGATEALKESSAPLHADTDTQGTFADFATLNGGTIEDGSITINGVSISIDADVTTIDEFINQVNASDAGVIMEYDYTNEVFRITTKEAGADAAISLSDTTGFLSVANVSTDTVRGTGTVNTSGKLTEADTGITGLLSDGGTYYFKINGYAFSFDENDTFKDVLNKVNSSGAGVNMIYDSSSDKILISSKESGPGTITFEDVQGNFLAATGLSSAIVTSGTAASFELNGVSMTRNSNEFEINGITFTLKEAGSATVTVNKDIDGIYNSIKEFVDQYNSTINLLNTRLSEEKVQDATTESLMRKGLLRGDSTVIGIRSQLRDTVTRQVDGLSNIYDTLMEIGITTTSDDFGKSGQLQIDETKLKDALENNLDAVKKVFFDDTDGDEEVDDGELGVLASLYSTIEGYISTETTSYNGRSYKVGIIPMRLDSIDQLIDDYDDKMASYEDRLELIETRYWRQFTEMEKALSQLQNQSAWLTSQLGSLPSASVS